MVRLSLIFFLLLACSSSAVLTGYTVDEKPYKGTNSYKRDYIRPYWQCVSKNINVDCNVE